jgi:ATP-dependent protease ClpP protease subunit
VYNFPIIILIVPKLETITRSKYTNKVIGKTAFMLLNKPIGQSTDKETAISGPEFADEMYSQKSSGNDVTVKINSLGGNVGMGWDMVDSIIETKAKTENVGFAYSMAGICLIVGSERTAYPHTRAMIHAPRTADGKKHFHTELVKDQFRTILKNHTKFTEEEINEMIDSGKDYFFNANEMLAKGMIDRIIQTGLYGNTSGLSDIQAYEYYNSLIEEQETKTEDMEFLNNFFGTKTDSETAAKAVQMKSDYDTLKASKVADDKRISDLEKELATLKDERSRGDATKKATELIENAEKAGKLGALKAEDKAKLIESAVANFEAYEIMIKNMKAQKTVSAAAVIVEESKGDKTYEWLANNAPSELNRIATEEPELFNKLSDEYIESKKTKS